MISYCRVPSKICHIGKLHRISPRLNVTEARNLDAIKEEFSRQASIFEKGWERRSHMSTSELMGQIMDHLHHHISHHQKFSIKALDVACGTGIFTRSLASSTYCTSVSGVDASPSMLKEARAKQEYHALQCDINYIEGDAASLPFENNCFDLVTCRLAIHHFQDPQQQLSEMARVCKPGGVVCIVDITSSEASLVAKNMNRLERLRDPSHTASLSPSELVSQVERSGLTVLSDGDANTQNNSVKVRTKLGRRKSGTCFERSCQGR
eukprot:GSChrysophyteH1.ASY1.ANO1.2315.1 assembled CDS